MQGKFGCMHRVNDEYKKVYEGFLTDIHVTEGTVETLYPEQSPCGHSAYRMDFNDHIGHGYWEVNRLDKDLICSIAKCSYCEDFHLTYTAVQDYYIIRYVTSGKYAVNIEGRNTYPVPSGRISIQHIHKNEHLELTFPKGIVLSSVTIFVSSRYIHKLCALLPPDCQQHFAKVLVADFGLEGKEHPLEPYERNLICHLQNLTSSGELRRFFTHSKVKELLCSLLKKYTHPPETPTPNSAMTYAEKFKTVFDLLEQNYITPPSTQEISRKIGLNQTMLRQGFRALYGKSISEHCLEKRMNHACDLLCDKKRNITQVAEELGYGHSTNFTASFKRYFGMLPKDYRNGTPL